MYMKTGFYVVRTFLCIFPPLGTGCEMNVFKTFRIRPERLLNVLCTFNYVCPLSKECAQDEMVRYPNINVFSSRKTWNR